MSRPGWTWPSAFDPESGRAVADVLREISSDHSEIAPAIMLDASVELNWACDEVDYQRARINELGTMLKELYAAHRPRIGGDDAARIENLIAWYHDEV